MSSVTSNLRRLALVALGLAAAIGSLPRASADGAARACRSGPYRERGTMLECPSLGFIAVLPGRGWTFRESVPGLPRVLFAARLGRSFHVAVSSAASDGAPRDASKVLRDLYRRAAQGGRSRGLALTPPELGLSRPNRPTLAYEATGAIVNGQPQRSVHIWTCAWRGDGQRLEYHASWTGPSSAYDADLPETLLAMTAGFVLVDRSGRAIAD